jgi:diacylglycerol kinase (ATP)
MADPLAPCRYALICNPHARSGRGRRAWGSIAKELDDAGVPYRLRVSEHAGHAIAIAEEEATQGTEVLVAVGGDGTVSEVLCGLMRAQCPGQRRPALGILYTGTSPDICRFHRIPLDLTQATTSLLAGCRRAVDVGEIRFRRDGSGAAATATESDGQGRAWFLCSVNLGIGAAVARGSNGGLRKYFGDFLGTLLSMLGAIARWKPIDFTCAVDGEKMTLQRVINITVGKNPHIASGLKAVSPIEVDDGKMYLMVVKGFSLWGFLGNIPKLYRGTFQHHPNNLFRFIRSFSCPDTMGAQRVEFDGDARGFLPCSIELRHRALELIVPAPIQPGSGDPP